MADIKLFKTTAGTVAELSGGAVALERSLHLLFEKNLEALLDETKRAGRGLLAFIAVE